MANCKLLLNDGTSNLLLNDGTSVLLLNDDSCGGGPTPATSAALSGGRAKPKGKQLLQGDLGPKPSFTSMGLSQSRIQLVGKGISHGKKSIRVFHESVAIKRPHLMGESIGKILHKVRNESVSKLYFKHFSESFAIPHTSIQMDRQIKLEKLKILKELVEEISGLNKPSPWREFAVNETVNVEEFVAFTHTSSWIGNVRYNTETQELRILMNGKAYNHCNVPRRVFDAFEGAISKGEYWWRSIREQYDC